MYRYAIYKIALGPEEERNEDLAACGLVDGMASTMKNGTVLEWGLFCFVSVVAWVLFILQYDLNWQVLFYGIATDLLLALALVDMKIYELPPELNAVLGILGAIHILPDASNWYVYLIGAVLVSGLFLLIGLASGGRAMGGGDVKLMAVLGLLLGWQKILLVMLLGSVLGTLIHGAKMIFSKKEHLLAFGPYLSAGGILTMLYGQQVIDWYINTFLRR